VNNCGVFEMKALEEITDEHFHRQFNVNVLGLLHVAQAAAPHLKSGSSIINISSVVTSITPPGSAVYTGTKGAIDAITGVLAHELAPRGIRVNSVNPGLVETEGTRAASMIGTDWEKGFIAQTPLGRTGQPRDIADVVVFLASDSARWMTGEKLAVSGGLR
jgi:3-oxoacyl-[acyl-carrier protein] reductase